MRVDPVARVMVVLIGLLSACAVCWGADGLRVATWNISYYPGDRAGAIGTVAYGVWEGRSMDPDVVCLQEMLSRQAVLALVDALNQAPGSPGDWVAAPVFTSATSVLLTAMVYRSSKLELDAAVLVSPGGGPPRHPRNLVRYDMRPVGYPEDASIISIYPLHFKAGTGPGNEARRLDEAARLAADIAGLPPGRHVVLGADLNIRTPQEQAYRAINGSVANAGPLLDPISRVGSWHSNFAYRNIHTQSPTAGGGMDDRYDQILLSASLLDGVGMEYKGDFPTPWDLGTPEDPAHSYRAWGNDGSAYNQSLRIAGNTMVGPQIAQAIRDMADPDGHIPVFLDLLMPGRLRVIGRVVDLGGVRFGSSRDFGVRIANNGDTSLWGADGVAPLRYSFGYPEGVTGPGGVFHAAASVQSTPHVFTLDASGHPGGGDFTRNIMVSSDDPGAPVSSIEVVYRVIGCNEADASTPYGALNFLDIAAFLDAFVGGDASADLAEPFGRLDLFDITRFLDLFVAGCPR